MFNLFKNIRKTASAVFLGLDVLEYGLNFTGQPHEIEKT